MMRGAGDTQMAARHSGFREYCFLIGVDFRGQVGLWRDSARIISLLADDDS